MTALSDLVAEYRTWVASKGLPLMSADELEAELLTTTGSTDDRVVWLRDFRKRWEEAD